MSIEANSQTNIAAFLNVRKVGSSLNTFDDPQDAADTDCTDCMNTIFDRGYMEPRPGSILAWSKPASETNNLLNSVNAVTSNRLEYAIAIYAPNFYLRDEVNNQWIKINGAYTPATANIALPYGSIIWNNGVGDDRVYFGNGTEDTIRWIISLNYLATNALSTDTTLTLNSAVQFPASGTVVVKGNSGEFTLAYTSKTGSVLNLSSAVGQAVGSGSAVTMAIEDRNSMKKGKIFEKYQGRIMIANYLNNETTMNYSIVGNPEDYTAGSTPSSGGFYGFTQGTGEITGMVNMGTYLAIIKADSVHRFEFVIDSTNSTKLDQVSPLVTDSSMGCPNFKAWVKKNNTLYYPSKSSGFFSIAPLITGFQTSIDIKILSFKIQNLYQSLNFNSTTSTQYQTKIFWSCATASAIDTILVYDTLRSYWTKWNNLSVKDWLTYKGKLYFGSSQDGNFYQLFDTGYTDNSTPYTVSDTTKRFDFGNPSVPKTMSRVFVQGYMYSSTKLMVDVLINELGSLQLLTYTIDGSQPYVVQPISKALGMAMMGVPPLGLEDIPPSTAGLFKVYLALPIKYGFYNIQFKFYTYNLASYWSVTGIGMNPRVEFKIPENLVINPSGVVPVPSPIVSAQA